MLEFHWQATYCGPAPEPAEILLRWNFDPVLLLVLALLAHFAGRQRWGMSSVGVLVVAFVSPLCALSSALFSARVVHHVLLVAVAAPLLARAYPSRSAGNLMLPFAVSTLTLWGWHLPAAYDLALSHVAVYWAMQLTLLVSAIWFWREVFAADRPLVEAVGIVVAGFVQMGMLGAILTFATAPLYAAHAVAPLAWGITPLADQQLGGLLMWVPAGVPYALAAAIVVRRAWPRLESGSA